MFSLINIAIFFLWLVSAIIDYADFCYLWQLKEYRWDRFRDFTSTYQGKTYWLKYRLLWRSIIAIGVAFWPINDALTVKYFLILLFVVDLGYNVWKLAKRKLLHPKPTAKAVLIIILSILIEGSIFVLTRDWNIFLILLIIRFFVLSGMVILLGKPTTLLKKRLIKKAKEKINRQTNLTVIGITGSYGKSTVKRFLAHILSSQFRVIVTPGNINTEIGVAQFILKNEFQTGDILIVEMGAYREGEIKMISDMVKPQIGILTAINEQHLSLFGNIRTTQRTKYELLRSLPASGLAITNSDNFYCREFLPELPCAVATFGAEADFQPTCLIKEIKASRHNLSFTLSLANQDWPFELPIIGEHQVFNLAPCLLVAQHLGLSLETIRKSFSSLSSPIMIRHYGRCEIIDDSYNSNPNGFKAALDILSKFPSEKKRIVITRGMLELGEQSEEIHQQIGGEISFMADELVIISPDNSPALQRGQVEKYRLNTICIYSPEKLVTYLRGLRDTEAVILLENRLPSLAMQEILTNG